MGPGVEVVFVVVLVVFVVVLVVFVVVLVVLVLVVLTVVVDEVVIFGLHAARLPPTAVKYRTFHMTS